MPRSKSFHRFNSFLISRNFQQNFAMLITDTIDICVMCIHLCNTLYILRKNKSIILFMVQNKTMKKTIKMCASDKKWAQDAIIVFFIFSCKLTDGNLSSNFHSFSIATKNYDISKLHRFRLLCRRIKNWEEKIVVCRIRASVFQLVK